MTKKLNYNKSGAAARHKQKLRDEAIERQDAREKRTNEQQVALLRTRRGNSAKEIARLSE